MDANVVHERNDQVVGNLENDRVDGNPEKLPRGFALAWSTRGISISVNFLILGYLTFYLTDVVGMGAGLVGGLLLASKIFDGVTDLLVGFIIDKTKTKYGKARPYEIIIVPLWIATVLLFSVPDMPVVWQATYVFVLFSIINSVFATFLTNTDSVYLGRAVSTEINRSKVLAITGLVIMIVSISVSIIFPQLLAMWGETNYGWTKITLLFAVPLGLIGLIRFFAVKEKLEDPSKIKKYGLKESLLALKQNKYIFIFSLAAFFVHIVNGLSINITAYYFEYIVGDLGKMSIFYMTSIATPLLLLLFPSFIKKIGSINVAKVALIIGLFGSVVKIFAGSNMTLLIIGSLISGIGTIPITMMVAIYVIDCMDYGEWKTGKRVEGVTNSIYNFSTKIANGVAVGGLGLILSVVGYSGKLNVQSDLANGAIIALFSWIPAILFAIAFLILHFYDLDSKMDKIKADLKARHSS